MSSAQVGFVNSGPFRIVVLDDNPGDLHMIQQSIRDTGLDCTITTFSDGAAAIEYFDEATLPVPELVILDLNIPGVEGPSVLNRLRNNPLWSRVSIFIFTASPSPSDMVRTKNLGADRYLIKPMDLSGFLKFGQEIKAWLEDQDQFKRA